MKMLTVGQSGYKERADSGIVFKTKELNSALSKINEVEVITPTALSILAFRLRTGDTYDLADYLRSKGWDVTNTINPAAISYAVTNGNCLSLYTLFPWLIIILILYSQLQVQSFFGR